LDCLITFENDEGFSAFFIGNRHRCGIGSRGLGFPLGVFA
jgi:hypothetical protein